MSVSEPPRRVPERARSGDEREELVPRNALQGARGAAHGLCFGRVEQAHRSRDCHGRAGWRPEPVASPEHLQPLQAQPGSPGASERRPAPACEEGRAFRRVAHPVCKRCGELYLYPRVLCRRMCGCGGSIHRAFRSWASHWACSASLSLGRAAAPPPASTLTVATLREGPAPQAGLCLGGGPFPLSRRQRNVVGPAPRRSR